MWGPIERSESQADRPEECDTFYYVRWEKYAKDENRRVWRNRSLALLFVFFVACSIAGPQLYFFGTYTWNNPDGDFCFFDQESNQTSDEPLPGKGGDLNIAHEWHKWFMMNFITVAVVTLHTFWNIVDLVLERICCMKGLFSDRNAIGGRLL